MLLTNSISDYISVYIMVVSTQSYPDFCFKGLKRSHLISGLVPDIKLNWRYSYHCQCSRVEVTKASVLRVVNSIHTFFVSDFSIVHKTLLMFSHKIVLKFLVQFLTYILKSRNRFTF